MGRAKGFSPFRSLSLRVFVFVFLIMLSLTAQYEVPDAARLQLQIRKLDVLAGALYIGAHPDDENTALLSYLSLGRLVRTAYLALNRGEGGQNLIGPEQGDLLGVIRTQELLAARRVDGAQQFFTRAIDFGYSKTPEESLQKWGHDNVLADVVWVIRKFRPDVIITRFPKEGGGHGHHTASAILAEEAFHAAADSTKFPEQLRYVKPWQAKRIVWNRYSWGNQPITEEEKPKLVKINVGEYNALLGKSYSEIAGISRSFHKSQGFGDSQDRGEFIEYFRPTAGDTAKADFFEGIETGWKRIPGSQKVAAQLEEADRLFSSSEPTRAIPSLLQALTSMRSLPSDPWVEEKITDVQRVIASCSGLWLEAIAKEPTTTSGGQAKVTATAINRSSFPLQLKSVTELSSKQAETIEQNLPNNKPVSKELSIVVPDPAPVSQPYWLQANGDQPLATVAEQPLIGLPESPASHQVRFLLMASKVPLEFTVPVIYRWVDPVAGERYHNLEVIPQVAVRLLEPVTIVSETSSQSLRIELKNGADPVNGELKLNLPAGWTAQPPSIPFQLQKKNETAILVFNVAASEKSNSGELIAEAIIGDKKNSRGMISIDYPHIPPQMIFPIARGKLVHLKMKRTGDSIGYVVGSGDQIPDLLKQIGYNVTLLTDEDLNTANFSTFKAILLGIRAYNTRPVLKDVRSRLMDYVQQGGTLVVQYNTLGEFDGTTIGPYPFKISRDRVSVEDAPVTFLNPAHQLLTFPNPIGPENFQGWIQERGLYFPNEWDAHYETILASNDPGETPKAGGILFTRYGKGVYIYTSYSWFRQLPAGVPGAFPLFVNLISAGSKSE